MANILVVEDERNIALVLEDDLKLEGYEVEVAGDGETAIERARDGAFDLILLDVMLPRKNGFAVCRELRRAGLRTPIILLTAKSQEAEKVLGLELGADDYVTKPFSPKELAARVRAVLRRLPDESLQRGPAELRRGDLVLDVHKRQVSRAGKIIGLTSTEFNLLAVMAREPQRIFSRAELITRTLGYDFEGFDRTIDVHILNLRRKLEPDPDHPVYIKTAYGAGYKFVGNENSI